MGESWADSQNGIALLHHQNLGVISNVRKDESLMLIKLLWILGVIVFSLMQCVFNPNWSSYAIFQSLAWAKIVAEVDKQIIT